MEKLDKIDTKILLELDTDARKSFSEIGKKLRINKNNVQYRVDRLLKKGIIKKFVTQPSLSRFDLMLGKIYFQLSGFKKEDEEKFLFWITNNKKIDWVAKCEGRWDLMIGAYIKNLNQLTELKKEIFNKFGEYISDYSINFLIEGHTSQRTYLYDQKLMPAKIKEFAGVKSKSIKIDDANIEILKFIVNNARFNYTDLAQKFNLNVKTVKKRIIELEKTGAIRGYVTFLDPKKLGFSFFKLCIYLNKCDEKTNHLLNYCLSLPNVIHVIESLGPWEIELEIETRDLEEFYKLTHQIRNDFSDIIKKTEFVIISEELKLNFLPDS